MACLRKGEFTSHFSFGVEFVFSIVSTYVLLIILHISSSLQSSFGILSAEMSFGLFSCRLSNNNTIKSNENPYVLQFFTV